MAKPTSPLIISETIEPDIAQFNLEIPEDLYYLSGHFKEQPIVPGVVQIKWAIEFSQCLTQGEAQLYLEKIKFKRLIFSNVKVQLEIKINREKQKIDFQFTDERNTFSIGEFSYV